MKKNINKEREIAKVLYCGKRWDNRCVCCGKEVYGKKAHLHHLSSRTKKANMASLWATPMQEVEGKKCVLLCEECHIKLHKALGKVVSIAKSKKWIKENKGVA